MITDYGDSAVTSTFTLASTLFLLVYKQFHAALAILLAFCFAAICISLSKFAIYTGYIVLPNKFEIYSPSGHSAMSLAVYGTFAAIISSSQTGWRKIVPYLFFSSLIFLISISRVALANHTISDVIIGAVIGGIVLFCIWFVFLKDKVIHFCRLRFTLIPFIVAVTIHGIRFPAESLIRRFSQYFHSYMLS
ncbi:phosphatase PAP2 family protein [Methylomonas sp. AM2-LC]|uniref:phosphatase PAP2 family protein n=1 Tax=Methylomonas sp. AM2-LC TaxID=3153301 RepID=UPI003267D5BE